MKTRKQLQVKYIFVDYEQKDWQKRLDDAFDILFDEIEIDNERVEKTDYKVKAIYDHCG